MMRAIVDQMAALAKALEVAQPIVAGVMIEMCCGQNDAGLPHMHGLLDVRPSRRASTAALPGAASRVEPPAVRQASNSFAVRPATSFADAAGALEADASTELWPVDWIVPSQLRFDRHGHPGSQEIRFSLKRRRGAIRTSLHHAPHKSRVDRRESLEITREKGSSRVSPRCPVRSVNLGPCAALAAPILSLPTFTEELGTLESKSYRR